MSKNSKPVDNDADRELVGKAILDQHRDRAFEIGFIAGFLIVAVVIYFERAPISPAAIRNVALMLGLPAISLYLLVNKRKSKISAYVALLCVGCISAVIAGGIASVTSIAFKIGG